MYVEENGVFFKHGAHKHFSNPPLLNPGSALELKRKDGSCLSARYLKKVGLRTGFGVSFPPPNSTPLSLAFSSNNNLSDRER